MNLPRVTGQDRGYSQEKEHEITFSLEPPPGPASGQEVVAKEAGLEILILNPFIGLTEEGRGQNNEDLFFSIMRKNLDNLKKALVDADE